MAIGKLLLLLAVATCQHCASTAPNTRPPSDELRKQVGWELVVPRFAILGKALLWSLTLAECSVLFAASDYCAPGLSQSIIKVERDLCFFTSPAQIPLLIHADSNQPSQDNQRNTGNFALGLTTCPNCLYTFYGSHDALKKRCSNTHESDVEARISTVRYPEEALLWSLTLAECSVLFAASDYCAPAPIPNAPLQQDQLTHPVFLAGSVLSIAGSLLPNPLLPRPRQDVYVRTEHPPGSQAGHVGAILCRAAPQLHRLHWRGAWGLALRFQSPLVARGLFGVVPGLDAESRLTNVLACTWVSMVVAVCIGMMQRIRKGDDMLEKNFGEQWKEWARRVPYRTVPWVY
ncbi:hypothetical protein BU15DRAFT_69424 [Melanogaster broomeanus]|nr:hypothetical protein BU15DRAFT_69424 [Melanogaster broomeanus]